MLVMAIMVDIGDGAPGRGPAQASRITLPLKSPGPKTVRRGARFRPTVSGNGAERYLQNGPRSKDAPGGRRRRRLPGQFRRSFDRPDQVGSMSASGPAMSS